MDTSTLHYRKARINQFIVVFGVDASFYFGRSNTETGRKRSFLCSFPPLHPSAAGPCARIKVTPNLVFTEIEWRSKIRSRDETFFEEV